MQENNSLDMVLPFDNKYSHEIQADLTLWAHVFRQGLTDYVEALRRTRAVKKPTGKDAEAKIAIAEYELRTVTAWFESDKVRPGSFIWLCSLFNQEPEYVRSLVRNNWRTLHVKQHTGFIKARKAEEIGDE
jgi:hypothetical protein